MIQMEYSLKMAPDIWFPKATFKDHRLRPSNYRTYLKEKVNMKEYWDKSKTYRNAIFEKHVDHPKLLERKLRNFDEREKQYLEMKRLDEKVGVSYEEFAAGYKKFWKTEFQRGLKKAAVPATLGTLFAGSVAAAITASITDQ